MAETESGATGIGAAPSSSLELDPGLALRLRAALDQHGELVWRSLRRFGVPLSLVDDASQQVFVAFASRLTTVVPAKERSFLLATAVRVAANARRLQSRCREVPTDMADATRGGAPDAEQLLCWKERRRVLDRMLDELPLQQRSVFVLFELEGLSLPEIAESLKIPLGTATSRLRRARKRFEACVTAENEAGGER